MLARVASVSVWFRSKERLRNGIFGFGCVRNETTASFLVLFSLTTRKRLLRRLHKNVSPAQTDQLCWPTTPEIVKS